MNAFLLNRQLGSLTPSSLAKAQNARLLQSLCAAPGVTFTLSDHGDRGDGRPREPRSSASRATANAAGVNSIAIDRFEGRYLVSGGADSSVALWDLEQNVSSDVEGSAILPLGHSARTSTNASLGITDISFYPFDSLAFLTSGYDQTLKLFSSETLQASATFDLDSTIASHATSDVASHLLVACASQHPAVRLIDLKSGASTHSLAGHAGAVISVAWHPRNENLLASGATDGCCRIWDIRRSASSLGVLDLDDSIGVAGYDGAGSGARRRERGKSHAGPVNGLVWTDDGQYLVTAGLDEKMRVWNMTTGANTLANFGPALKNTHATKLPLTLAPSYLSSRGQEIVYFPNPQDILSFDLHSGTLHKRLRVVGPSRLHTSSGSVRNVVNKTTSTAWRAHNVEMFSAHSDGTIRCWRPHTWEDEAADLDSDAAAQGSEAEAVERKRKRDELDDIVRELSGKKVTFT